MSTSGTDQSVGQTRQGASLLDAMMSMFCVFLALISGGTWLGSFVGLHDLEQFYFADLGIKTIYCGSALLNGTLATLLIRRLSLCDAGASSQAVDRAIIPLVAFAAALPWIELWYAGYVDARYFGPSLGRTTNFGAVGCIAFLGYIIVRVPGMRLFQQADQMIRVLLTLGAIGALAAVVAYVGRT